MRCHCMQNVQTGLDFLRRKGVCSSLCRCMTVFVCALWHSETGRTHSKKYVFQHIYSLQHNFTLSGKLSGHSYRQLDYK